MRGGNQCMAGLTIQAGEQQHTSPCGQLLPCLNSQLLQHSMLLHHGSSLLPCTNTVQISQLCL